MSKAKQKKALQAIAGLSPDELAIVQTELTRRVQHNAPEFNKIAMIEGPAVPLETARRMAARAYDEGIEDTKGALIEQTNIILSRLRNYQSKMLVMVRAIDAAKHLCIAAQAGMRRDFYYTQLEIVASELAAAAVSARNVAAQLDTAFFSQTPTALWILVSDTQDAITAALTGDDSELIEIFRSHELNQMIFEHLDQINRGGRPAQPAGHKLLIAERLADLRQQYPNYELWRLAKRLLGELDRVKNPTADEAKARDMLGAQLARGPRALGQYASKCLALANAS